MPSEEGHGPRLDAGTWREIEQLFLRAVDLDTDGRRTLLEEAGSARPEVRAEVEAMLAAHDGATPPGIETRLLGADHLDTSLTGARIGPYRVARLLGRGGMGEVYLAERADDHYRQQVALKVVRPGLGGTELITRLRVERQILARLHHPNIATLLDGGVTDDGRPYLVMEYVDGVSLTEYCDRHRLTVRDRVRLFATVCRAVQYAHANLVVHRDLKASNFLVTADGTPKLLDFGIAKLLDTGAEGGTRAVTRAGAQPLTPEHAAPEQLHGDPITTATDVYALGRLLYTLLTGRPAFRFGTADPRTIERIVETHEPTRPSVAVTADGVQGGGPSSAAPTPTAIERAALRGARPEQLRRHLSGDLDRITLMALRPEPERRYHSAGQLAEDVERYLVGRPVLAQADTLAYRTGKFVTRNRFAVSAAAAAVAAVLAFGVVTGLQNRAVVRERAAALAAGAIAERERQEALDRRREAEDVLEFVVGLFELPDRASNRGTTVTAMEILQNGASRVERELADRPATQAALMDALGRVYDGLGRWEEGGALLERALQIERARDPASLDVAARLYSLAILRYNERNCQAADSLFREALALRRRALGDDHALVAWTRAGLARCTFQRGDFDETAALYGDALAVLPDAIGTDAPEVFQALLRYAGALRLRGDGDEANVVYAEVLDLQRRTFGADHPMLIPALVNLAHGADERDDPAAAARYRREARMLQTRWLTAAAASDPDQVVRVAGAYVGLGRHLVRTGRLAQAEPVMREGAAVFDTAMGPAHPWSVATRAIRAVPLFGLGRADEAEALVEDALARLVTRGRLSAQTLFFVSRVAQDLHYIGQPGWADRFQALLPETAVLPTSGAPVAVPPSGR